MKTAKYRPLSVAETAALGAEIEALRERTVADLGERDARHIRRVFTAVRVAEVTGRGLLLLGAFLPGAAMILAWLAGTFALALSKVLDNMELGHNVIHGQYDWMGDPAFDSRTFEWDIVATSENWKQTHNYRHHAYTNIHGMDLDLGYDVLRLFPEQRWTPVQLGQPLYALVFALIFEWGVAAQHLRLGRWFKRRITTRRMLTEFRPVGRKIGRQLIKDYLVFPLLAGPGFLFVLSGNLVANLLRNLWTYTTIFCGHFTSDVVTFPKSVLAGETRAQWYLRQIRGSSNLTGGRWIDLLSGNLSHQIEHHLFPDVPANRYAEMAPAVRDICARYGQHYNTGSLPRQFSQVVWRILRHSFPSRPALQAG